MPLVFFVISLIGAIVVGIDALHSVPPPISSPSPTISNSQKNNQVNYNNPTPTSNSDPIIDCNTKSIGTLKERRSICTTSVDCLINGKYYLAKNNDECNSWVKQAQPSQQNYQQPVYQAPQYTLPTIQQYAAPTIPPTTSSSFNDCITRVNSARDTCNQQCYAQRDTSGDQQYTGNNSPYLLCLDDCQRKNPYNCN